MPIIIILSVLCGLINASLASRKDLSVKLHIALGVILGPIGVLTTALVTSKGAAKAD